MKNVWTDSQGTIHSPSPGRSRSCFRSPVRRFLLVSATSAALARTLARVWFRTITFNFENYNTAEAEVLRLLYGESPVGQRRGVSIGGREVAEPPVRRELRHSLGGNHFHFDPV